LRPYSPIKVQKAAIAALEDIKARDITVLDTRPLTAMYDTLIVATAESARQTKALARHVRDKVIEAGGQVLSIEGEESGEWVLVDATEMVVHIMLPTTRALYNLEELWTAPEPIRRLKVVKPVVPAAPKISAGKTAAKAPAAAKTPVAAKAPATKAVVAITGKPATRKPALKAPAAKTAAAKKTATKAPAAKKTAAKKPATKPAAKQAAHKPATKKPAGKAAAVNKVTTKKTAAKKPAAKAAATKKPAAKKLVVKRRSA